VGDVPIVEGSLEHAVKGSVDVRDREVELYRMNPPCVLCANCRDPSATMPAGDNDWAKRERPAEDDEFEGAMPLRVKSR
jgi:hypothetical protein